MADDSPPLATPLAEISQGPSRFELFLDQNQKSLLVLLILIILGVAGWIVYGGIEEGNQITAGNELYRASDAAAFQKVIADHPDTPAAGTARILLAEKQWTDGQKDASIETLRSYLSASPNHPGIPAAKASVAAKLMQLGKTEEAVSAFQELVDSPQAAYLAPYALLCLGDIALAGGDKEKAKSYYKRAEADFANSSFNDKIAQRIASMDSARPAEIAPPPPPAPEPNPANPAFPTPLAPDAVPQNSTSVPPAATDKTPESAPATNSPDTSNKE